MKKAPLLLHPEQETVQKQPWERMEGEPARWFLLFRAYVLMGRDRSLRAVAAQEKRPQKATKGVHQHDAYDAAGDDTIKVSISGALRRAATQWQWKERAEAWDLDVRKEHHKALLSHLDHEAEYISKAQRLDALDTLMKNLMRVALEEYVAATNYKHWLAMHRQMLATLREIRKEMQAVEKLGASSLSEVTERLLYG